MSLQSNSDSSIFRSPPVKANGQEKITPHPKAPDGIPNYHHHHPTANFHVWEIFSFTLISHQTRDRRRPQCCTFCPWRLKLCPPCIASISVVCQDPLTAACYGGKPQKSASDATTAPTRSWQRKGSENQNHAYFQRTFVSLSESIRCLRFNQARPRYYSSG